MTALRALLAEIVDYAGLFPPAALDMATAVRNYADYRVDRGSWMLGRFVVPVARLDEFDNARASITGDMEQPWRLSALLGADALTDIGVARTFNRVHGGSVVIDSLEGRVGLSDIAASVASCGDHLELFVEGSVEHDPTMLVEVLQRTGARAKIRTGGVTADAIPSPDLVVRFMRACLDRGVPFKATAGLHHPLRAEYPLTYGADAPTSVMFGYINVFLAAALMANGLSDADAVLLLDERDPGAFDIAADHIAWRAKVLTIDQARAARELVAVSFGSCSFREPIDELRSIVGAAA